MAYLIVSKEDEILDTNNLSCFRFKKKVTLNQLPVLNMTYFFGKVPVFRFKVHRKHIASFCFEKIFCDIGL